jgi:hypothetical protein
MIVERPNFNGFKVIEPFVAIAGLRWPWNCLIDQAYPSSGENHWQKSRPRKQL